MYSSNALYAQRRAQLGRLMGAALIAILPTAP